MRWYRWQTLTLDAASLLLFAAGIAVKDPSLGGSLVTFGVLTYGAGPPIVHWSHRRGGAAWMDLLLRFDLPGLFGLVGLAVGPWGSHSSGADPFLCFAAFAPRSDGLAGAFAGAVSAQLIDAIFLAREPVSDGATVHATAPWSPAVGFVPGGGASLGIAGSF